MLLGALTVERLRTLVVIADTDAALGVEAVGPEAANVDVGLLHVHVGEEEPDAEDGLGEDIENSVGNDLGIDRGLARAVGDTPNAAISSAQVSGQPRDKR